MDPNTSDLQQEIEALRAHWRGSEGSLQVEIERLQKLIDGESIDTAFANAAHAPGSSNVAVIARFAKYFQQPYRWHRTGVISMASHFMCDADDIDYLPGYLALVLHHAEQDLEVLDAIYESAMQLSVLRPYIAALRLQLQGSMPNAGCIAPAVRGLVSNPEMQLTELADWSKWPPEIKELVKKLERRAV